MEILSLLERSGVIKHGGHFVLKSGRHASDYADFDNAFPDQKLMERIGFEMAVPLAALNVEAVAAPGVGGIALLHPVVRGLHTKLKRWVRAYWADKDGDQFAIERGDWLREVEGKRVAVVEDVITRTDRTSTLGSVVSLLEDAGAEVVGAQVVLNRQGATAESLQLPYFGQLAAPSYPSWKPEECRSCVKGEPVVRVGRWEGFIRINPHWRTIGWHEL